MIPPRSFAKYFIQPVLDHLGKVEPRLNTEAAANLMLGTAIMESRLTYLEQQGGPARSFFQIEQPTFEDIHDRYLHRHPELKMAVESFATLTVSPWEDIAQTPKFACAIARIKYWMSPAPLPAADDIDGLGVYWDLVYNANAEHGTAVKWALLYRRHVIGDAR